MLERPLTPRPPLPHAGEGQPVIGERVPSVDGPEKLTGRARYGADLSLPGMLHARLLLSPYAHAKIVGVDKSAALALPGVAAVVTGDDLAPIVKVPPTTRARTLLARERVRFCGQPVAAVLAESAAVAEDALALIEVEYEVLPPVLDPAEAISPGAPLVWESGLPGRPADEGAHGGGGSSNGAEQSAGNLASSVAHDRGDIAAGFAEADIVLERTYRTPIIHQGYLEPHAALVSTDPMGRLTVWSSTQGIFHTREDVAAVLGLSPTDVKIVPTTIGGGFGGKIVLIQPLAAALSVYAKRPVSLVLTRMDEMFISTPAPAATITVKIGARRDGTLTALDADITYDNGALPGAPVVISCLAVGILYRFPHLQIRGREVMTHKAPQGPYRAPGAVQGLYALECTMDDLAHELGRDPIELRLQNLCEEGDPMPNGEPWPRWGLRECLERLREHPAWKHRASRPNEGVGIACGGWLGGLQPASAACSLDSDGTLRVMTGAVDLAGAHTGLAMLAGEAFGVPAEKVRILTADTDAAPYNGLSGGSKITLTSGEAIRAAALQARERMLAIASDRLEVSADDLEIVGDSVVVRGAEQRSITIARLQALGIEYGGKYEPIAGHGNSAIHHKAPGFGAQLTRVRVDPETGRAEILEHVAVMDVGLAINPSGIEGQIRGGVAQGVGWALYEQMLYDEGGQLLTGTLQDYALPAAHQVPPIESIIVEVPSDSGSLGIRGVGEPPVVGAPIAIANAIRDAIGVRIPDIPMTPERILAGLRGATLQQPLPVPGNGDSHSPSADRAGVAGAEAASLDRQHPA